MVGRLVTQAVLLLGIGAAPWAVPAPSPLPRSATSSLPRSDDVTVETATGARVREAGAPWRAARGGERLRLPVDVEIDAPGGALGLAYRGARVRIEGPARAAVGLPSRAWTLWLDQGRLRGVARRGEIVAHTPTATWRGAAFDLEVEPARSFATAEAELRVQVGDATRSLSPGSTAVAVDGRLELTEAGADAPGRTEPDARVERARPVGEASAPPPRASRPERAPSAPSAARRSDGPRAEPKTTEPRRAPEPEAAPSSPRRRSRARRPTEPPPRLEVDWTKPGRPEDNPLGRMKREAPAPGDAR